MIGFPKKFFITIILILFSTTSQAMDELEWSYSGGTGPDHWGELSSEYIDCFSGSLQSPIDITNPKPSNLSPIKFFYLKSLRMALDNTGHTVEVDFAEGNDIILGKTAYTLKQVHFHTPSEHTLNGDQYPMEIHFVHVSKSHRIAVIGIFVEEGEENDKFKQIIKYLPKNKNDSDMFYHKNISPDYLLPENREYYKYTGSLTTPPCTEGVSWFILKEHVPMSMDQINAIREAVGTNNRPIQPTNNRSIREIIKEHDAPVPDAPSEESASEEAEESKEEETPTEETDEASEESPEEEAEAEEAEAEEATEEVTEEPVAEEVSETPVQEEAPSEEPVAEEIEESEVEEIETEEVEESIIEDIELEESSEVLVD